MLNFKNVTTVICIIFLFAINIIAQDIESMEANLNSLNKTLIKEQTNLDSLKIHLNNKVKQIDREKEKEARDNTKITQLMASSLTISNEIDVQNKKVETLETEIELLKKKLNDRYSSVIDSLNSLEKETIKNYNKDEVESQIAFYTEKKLNVAPKINLLSLYPEKILEIDLKKINNSSEKQIYKDYILKALNEVNDRLEDIEIRTEETEKIITLKKKTKRFLEESEFESSLRPGELSTEKAVATTENNKNTGITTYSGAALISQAQSYNLLLNQLNFEQKTDANIKWKIFLDDKNFSISIEEYQELLSLVKKRLQEYKVVLLHKLNKAK